MRSVLLRRPAARGRHNGHVGLRASAVGIVAALAFSAIGPAPAFAAACSGRGCDGKDPSATGCEAGATTADTADLGSAGIVELRWSPRCKTNWVRVRKFAGASQLTLSVTQRATGRTVTYQASPTPGSHWGNMVYSPGCATGFADSSIFYASVESSDC